ncbi:MAG: Radical domain protein [Sporomusa sp.]|nr:Radical domain protein [Sporomusa sp.]
MKRFKKIYIEITNVCNLACSFCPPTRRSPEFMNIETFSKILDQIKHYTDYIYLHIKGEPLLHPELDKFLDLGYTKGFKINITTNGTLIKKVKDKLMGKPGLRQVNFSLHSIDGNEGYDKKTEYIHNILTFANEARAKSDVIVAFRLWNLEQDYGANTSNVRNDELLELIEKEFSLDFKIQDFANTNRGVKIADRLYINQDRRFQWPDLKEKEDDGIGFCYGLRDQAAILVDGTVVPCCLDGEGVINLGNINVTQFSEIINSERAMAVYNGFSRRYAVEELCRKCGYRSKF